MKTVFLRTLFYANLLVSAVAAPTGYQTVFSSAEGYQPGPLPASGGWRFVGTAPSIISNPGSPGGQVVTIPSDTQLIRGIDDGGTAISVRLSLKPSFGSAAADTSVAELGPVSVIFLRDGDTGRASCLAGGAGVVTLVADSIPLDEQGRSQSVLTVQVGLDAGWSKATLSVGVATTVVELPNGKAQRSPLELVISAGATGSIEVGSVGIAPPDTTAVNPSAGDLGKAGGDQSNPSSLEGAAGGKSGVSPFRVTPASLASSKATPAVTLAAKPAKASSLEVFTPGSRLITQQDTAATSTTTK